MDMHIRGIDELTELKIRNTAVKNNISMNELVLKILNQWALAPEIKSIDSKYDQFARYILQLYQHDREESVALQKELIDHLTWFRKIRRETEID